MAAKTSRPSRRAEIKTQGKSLRRTDVSWEPLGQPFDCTSERDFALQYKITAADVPDGVAMFRLQTEQPLLAAKEDTVRQPYTIVQGAVSKPLEYHFANPG